MYYPRKMVVPPQALSQFRVKEMAVTSPVSRGSTARSWTIQPPIGGGASQLLGALADVILKVDLISRPGARRR